MAPCPGDGDWRRLPEQTSKETDPAKLMILVEKLCCALDGVRKEKSQLPAIPPGQRFPPEMSQGFFSAIRSHPLLPKDGLVESKGLQNRALWRAHQYRRQAVSSLVLLSIPIATTPHCVRISNT